MIHPQTKVLVIAFDGNKGGAIASHDGEIMLYGLQKVSTHELVNGNGLMEGVTQSRIGYQKEEEK